MNSTTLCHVWDELRDEPTLFDVMTVVGFGLNIACFCSFLRVRQIIARMSTIDSHIRWVLFIDHWILIDWLIYQITVDFLHHLTSRPSVYGLWFERGKNRSFANILRLSGACFTKRTVQNSDTRAHMRGDANASFHHGQLQTFPSIRRCYWPSCLDCSTQSPML